MNKETIALAVISFCKDRTKPCPCCGEALDTSDHLECRRALRRTIKRGGEGTLPLEPTRNLDYYDHPKWH